MPSYYREGLPRTILEAMSCGRAIITTDWPGCRDAVEDGVNGFLVAIKDFNELAKNFKVLINNEKMVLEMCDNSYEKCKTIYSVDIVNKKMKEIIQY